MEPSTQSPSIPNRNISTCTKQNPSFRWELITHTCTFTLLSKKVRFFRVRTHREKRLKIRTQQAWSDDLRYFLGKPNWSYRFSCRSKIPIQGPLQSPIDQKYWNRIPCRPKLPVHSPLYAKKRQYTAVQGFQLPKTSVQGPKSAKNAGTGPPVCQKRRYRIPCMSKMPI